MEPGTKLPGHLDLAGHLETLLDPEARWNIAGVAVGGPASLPPCPEKH